MRYWITLVSVLCLTAIPFQAAEGSAPLATVTIALNAPTGTPLRVYATTRVRMRIGQPVQAKLIDPVYAFDRVVLPAGAEVEGHVTELKPIPKFERAKAVINGDFTPLHTALVSFTAVRLADGRQLDIQTAGSQGLRSIYSPPRPVKKKQKVGAATKQSTVSANAKQQVKDQINSQINARTRGVIDVVRSPNKKEWLEDYLIAKLPYHPQWYRRNTRFDAILGAPLAFGETTLSVASLQKVGTEPAPDSIAHVRLLSAFSSGDAKVGQLISGVLSEPVFAADHQLVLPEGTEVTGKVRQVRAARWFHRGGQLRFTFDQLKPPAIAMLPEQPTPRQTMTQLTGAETETTSAMAKVKVDEEGTAKATESKKRLLGPAIALIVAGRSFDNDAGRHAQGASGTGGAEANYGGRTAGGFSGFGLLGSLAAQGSHTVGSVLGVYGLGWSVYNTIISRGQEVEFRQNAPVEIRFTPRGNPAPGKAQPLVALGAH